MGWIMIASSSEGLIASLRIVSKFWWGAFPSALVFLARESLIR